MASLVFRNDDVNANSVDLDNIYNLLVTKYPDCAILSCITVFCRNMPGASQIYPDLPLRGKPLDYLLDVNRARISHSHAEIDNPNVKVASHGLWHFDHTEVDTQLKKASIVSSCRLLQTDTFVPPFNKWDAEVELICASNGIQLVKSEQEDYLSFEHNKFDPNHQNWYFHSWKWNYGKLKEYLNV